MLTEKTLGFMLTTACNLNCRLCTSSIPQFKKHGVSFFETAQNFRQELTEIFHIYDHIGTISISGGEPLLNRELPEITEIALREFSEKFDQFRIITNGTLVPSKPLLQAVRTYTKGNADFQIDDYGENSGQVSNIVKVLEENEIPYRIKKYYGEDQYRDGWVDLGELDEWKNYTEEKAQYVLDHCRNAHMKAIIVYDGKLFLCHRGLTSYALGYLDTDPREYIDLLGQTQSPQEKNRIAAAFGSKPIQACYYCNGYDPENSPRFSAAEQF